MGCEGENLRLRRNGACFKYGKQMHTKVLSNCIEEYD